MRDTVEGGKPVRAARSPLLSQVSFGANAASSDSARASGTTMGRVLTLPSGPPPRGARLAAGARASSFADCRLEMDDAASTVIGGLCLGISGMSPTHNENRAAFNTNSPPFWRSESCALRAHALRQRGRASQGNDRPLVDRKPALTDQIREFDV